MSEKVTKSVLKVRVEELAGGYVLYQVLEQDKILDGIKYKNIQRVLCPSVGDDYNYLRGSQIELDFQPDYSNEVTKETILQRFREILDWEGFQKSDKELEIKMFITDSGEYLFRLETKDDCKRLLRYKLWYEDCKYFYKVIYCDESLRGYFIDFVNKTFEESPLDKPLIGHSKIFFTGQVKQYDYNVDSQSVLNKTIYEIAEIVKETLEKEFCKPSTNLVEFKETSPNIYEILVTEV